MELLPLTLSPRLRRWLTTAVLAVGIVVFGLSVHRHYPLQYWLFPRYVGYWLCCAGLGMACLLSGMRVTSALGTHTLRVGERLLLSFACGVLLFGLGVFVGGILGLYGTAFFVGWPIVLAFAGGGGPWRLLRRWARSGLVQRTLPPRSVLALACLSFLGLGLIAVYLHVLTPENIGVDARWYHLSIAEQYATTGAIRRFPEGWYLGAYPQLATWLYAWAFQFPGTLFDRVSLAAHLEWSLFLATVCGLAPLVRRLLSGTRVPLAGAAIFLFPSIWLYDTNLNAGADHVVAFWAAPLAVATAAALRTLDARHVVLASAMAAGALLTKYQAIYLVLPAALVLLVAVVRAGRTRLILPGLAALLGLTAPHWLKNLLFYGDPLYPLLHRWLPSHPFHAGAAEAMVGTYFPQQFLLTGDVWQKVGKTFRALLTFAFVPHNWKNLNLPQPTFGSLFTLRVRT